MQYHKSFSSQSQLTHQLHCPIRVAMSSLGKELGFLARRDLSLILDKLSPTGNDWRGLVDKMGFSYQVNVAMGQQDSPTLSLLEEWERVYGERGIFVF